MKVNLDLEKEKEITPNEKRANEFDLRRKLVSEYGDASDEEIREKEEEKVKREKEEHERDYPDAPADLGKIKPELNESFNDQIAHRDQETAKNL